MVLAEITQGKMLRWRPLSLLLLLRVCRTILQVKIYKKPRPFYPFWKLYLPQRPNTSNKRAVDKPYSDSSYPIGHPNDNKNLLGRPQVERPQLKKEKEAQC